MQNVKSAMDNQTAYLDTAEGDDLDAALQTYFDDMRKETTRDAITSSEIIMAYEDHLLEASGESWESIQAMKNDELATFREKNKGDMEKQIPNALRLNEKRVECQKAGESTIIGRYNFKEKKIISFDEDRLYSLSSV